MEMVLRGTSRFLASLKSYKVAKWVAMAIQVFFAEIDRKEVFDESLEDATVRRYFSILWLFASINIKNIQELRTQKKMAYY